MSWVLHRVVSPLVRPHIGGGCERIIGICKPLALIDFDRRLEGLVAVVAGLIAVLRNALHVIKRVHGTCYFVEIHLGMVQLISGISSTHPL